MRDEMTEEILVRKEISRKISSDQLWRMFRLYCENVRKKLFLDANHPGTSRGQGVPEIHDGDDLLLLYTEETGSGRGSG